MKYCVRGMKLLLSMILIIGFVLIPATSAQAVTVYQSVDLEFEEGYIFVGESHAILAAHAYGQVVDEFGNIPGMEGVTFFYECNDSIAVNEEKSPNTFIMKGNLFFVFEGNSDADFAMQILPSFIYSDGKGKQGGAVQKIHQIMEANPKVQHWNIITWHGATSCRRGLSNAQYYINSYHNWIDYEFPEADMYILGQSTMTKAYRSVKENADAFNNAIQMEFMDNYLDYTGFFNDRYPQGMLDPKMRADLIHWNFDVYMEVFNDIMKNIQKKEMTTLSECDKIKTVEATAVVKRQVSEIKKK